MALPNHLKHYLKQSQIKSRDFLSSPVIDDPRAVLRLSLIIPGGHSELHYHILLQCVEYQGVEMLLLCGYSKYLTIPTQVQPLIREHLNQRNSTVLAGKGVWAVYFGKRGLAEIGLVTSLIVCQWKAETLQWLFSAAIRKISEDFGSLIPFLLSIYIQDRDFQKRHDEFKAQAEYLERIGLTTHNKYIFDLADITSKVLRSLEVAHPKLSSSLYEKAELIYSESAVFGSEPIKIDWVIIIDLCIIEVQMREIILNEREVKFTSDSSILEIWNYISRTSGDFPASSFLLSPSNSLRFSLKAVHCSLTKDERAPYIRLLIETSRSIIKSTLQPILKIHSNPVFEERQEQSSSSISNRTQECSFANVQELREAVTKAVWTKHFIPTVAKDRDTVALDENSGARLLANLQDRMNEQKIKAFVLEIAVDGLYFHQLPLHCIYDTHKGLKLAPFFSASDISSASLREDYDSFVTASISKWFSTNFLPSIVSIEFSNFADQKLTDPGKLFGVPETARYYNRLNSENVLVKNVSEEILWQLGRFITLSHHNLVRILGLTMYKNRHFLVTEFAKMDLLTYLRPDLSMRERFGLVIDVANGLKYMHENGEFHLRLKPESVLIASDGHAMLTDFGLFHKKVENNAREFLYAAPELLDPPTEPLDLNKEKVDVWALGLLMHYTLIPMADRNLFGRFWRSNISKQDFLKEIWLWRRRPYIPADFERKQPKLVLLMRSCLYPDPAHRPSLPKVLFDLESFLAL